MASKKEQVEQFKKWKTVVTIEDHLEDCGFGSWVMESLINETELISKLKIKALNSQILGMVGTQKMLNEIGGLKP
jgi:transketolase